MLTDTRSETADAKTASQFDLWWFVAVGSVLLAVMAASLFSPDLITGSNQEHLPLAGMMDWLWGLIAIAYLAFVRSERATVTLGLSVAILWLAVAVTSIASPSMVTGTDPTQIPIAALIAPIVGCLATGFISLNAMHRRD
jgi:hypothetical protein